MFSTILEHLSRKRDKVIIEENTDNFLQFTVKNKYFEKFFTVFYIDSETPKDFVPNLQRERPMYKYYYLDFEQENYPQDGNLVTITGWKWFHNEDEVISEIKRLCRNWRR